MPVRVLTCAHCRKPMGEIRDATLRVGLAVLCAPCAEELLPVKETASSSEGPGIGDIPDFLKSLFGGGHGSNFRD